MLRSIHITQILTAISLVCFITIERLHGLFFLPYEFNLGSRFGRYGSFGGPESEAAFWTIFAALIGVLLIKLLSLQRQWTFWYKADVITSLIVLFYVMESYFLNDSTVNNNWGTLLIYTCTFGLLSLGLTLRIVGAFVRK